MVPPHQLQPGCFWKLLSEAPVPASPAPHLNLVSKLCHWEVPHQPLLKRGALGREARRRGQHFQDVAARRR